MGTVGQILVPWSKELIFRQEGRHKKEYSGWCSGSLRQPPEKMKVLSYQPMHLLANASLLIHSYKYGIHSHVYDDVFFLHTYEYIYLTPPCSLSLGQNCCAYFAFDSILPNIIDILQACHSLISCWCFSGTTNIFGTQMVTPSMRCHLLAMYPFHNILYQQLEWMVLLNIIDWCLFYHAVVNFSSSCISVS
jgi:hypothetical protein